MGDWLLDHGFNRGGYPTLIGVAAQYGLQNIMLFEHYDDAYDGNYGVLGSDGASLKARYSRLQQFFAEHPVESIFR
ncbi:hypothetical protein KQH49_07625 [Mycetohabitans sp. B5]|nr:hypothetical protein [Mycetohabitans sp. B5]MCG1054828.1 hypothetical protein [Mycetohabitans sp. B5]